MTAEERSDYRGDWDRGGFESEPRDSDRDRDDVRDRRDTDRGYRSDWDHADYIGDWDRDHR